MKVLCIEDQPEKLQNIKALLDEFNFEKVEIASNYQDGMFDLWIESYNILLLDMSLPIAKKNYHKDSFNSFAGLSVFREIKRRNLEIKVIVITGFRDFEQGTRIITYEELEKDIINKYDAYYVGYVQYDSTSMEWQVKLKEILRRHQ